MSAIKTTSAGLSPRELDILRGIAADKTYPVIARELGLSYNTVKTYASRIFEKLGVRSKVGLAVYAINNRLTG
jgi:DNA-binding NarL/FixJ family response regulator